jgi:conjugal transfer/entry exclusion protein
MPGTDLNIVRIHAKPAPVRGPVPVRPMAPVRAPSLPGVVTRDVDYSKIREAVTTVEAMRTQINLLAQQIQALTNGLNNLNRILILEIAP